MTLYDELKWRGLIKDEAGDDIKDVINSCNATFYWGTDPTADSLHIGHYSSLIMAKRLARAGHHPILLVGGATGMIGDPRPTAEREIISKETVLNNVASIKAQVEKIFGDLDVRVVNNYDWTKDINILDFLRDVGKYINVNYMLDKDIIRRRLDTGITFAEFTYTLLQGFDFCYLYEKYGCVMQAAGSDQWGNITTGVDLINKKLGKKAYAFTMPLILDSTGKKFGKSEGNALWLDINKTSAYELYQFLINATDDKILEYLKVYTFLSKEEIESIYAKHLEKPEERLAQKTLAKEIITDLHGEDEYKHAVEVSEALFTNNYSNLSDKDILSIFKGVPTIKAEDKPILDFLVDNKIVQSRREAREFITSGALTLNGEAITEETKLDLDRNYSIIRRGKKKYYLITK